MSDDADIKAAFLAGWTAGFYDGGDHDCRMIPPTAERAWAARAKTPSRAVVSGSEPHKVISPWAYDQAVREMACFRCQAMPGEPCRTPSHVKREPHLERTRRYRDFIGEQEFNRRHQKGLAVR